MMTIAYIFLTIVILGVVWWAVQQLLPLLPIGEPFMTILRVLMIVFMVFVVVWVIASLLGLVSGTGIGHPFLLR